MCFKLGQVTGFRIMDFETSHKMLGFVPHPSLRDANTVGEWDGDHFRRGCETGSIAIVLLVVLFTVLLEVLSCVGGKI